MIDTTQLDETARPEAIELREALVEYKQSSGRMFPTCSEVLEVIRDLGYSLPSTDDEASGEDAELPTEPVAEPAIV